jgi:predicted O-methyltransferase YrrM
MSTRTIEMTERLHGYLLAQGVREHPALARLREETQARFADASGMQISPEQGALMALLVELTGARRLLEVGTFTGYSALASALAMPSDGRITACDLSVEWTDLARRHWALAGVADRIELRLGAADRTLDALLAEGYADRYDMMFVDADKTGYAGYYERGLRLVRPGGLILADNTLWGGAVADPARQDEDTAALRAFNARLHDDPRVSTCIVPVGDGLTLARRRA